MSNIPLKTITFPGLDDTYTIPQVDDTLLTAGAAADAKKTGDEITDLKEALTTAETTLPTKADKDGTVASAEQLLSDVGTEDKAPYLFRATPYDSTRVDEEVVGCSVGWNQLVPDAKIHLTETVAQDVTAEKWGTTIGTLSDVVIDHVLFAVSALQDGKCVPSWASGYSLLGESVAEQTKTYNIYKATSAIVANKSAVFRLKAGLTAGTYKADINLIDLTAWFGTTIADYAHTLETATAGSGVAWIKALLPGGYIPYSAPKMESVSGLSGHRFSGKNILGGLTLGQAIVDAVGDLVACNFGQDSDGDYVAFTAGTAGNPLADKCFTKSLPFKPNTQYTLIFDVKKALSTSTSTNMVIKYTDGTTERTGSLSQPANVKQTLIFTSAAGKTVEGFYTANHGSTTYVYYEGSGIFEGVLTAADFEPYKATTYALDSDLTLRGILKMDSDHNVYADGDVYLGEGKKNERYAEVDLGDLTWTYDTTSLSVPVFKATITGMKGGNTNFVNVKYVTAGNNRNALVNTNLGIAPWNNSGEVIAIRDDAYSSVNAFVQAVTGMKLVYEKATASIEDALPYASPQNCEPGGTEEYVYAEGGSGVPVGHNSRYQKNMRSELERVSVAVPDAPSSNGTYTLKATVASTGVTYAWVSD